MEVCPSWTPTVGFWERVRIPDKKELAQSYLPPALNEGAMLPAAAAILWPSWKGQTPTDSGPDTNDQLNKLQDPDLQCYV